MKHYRPKNNQKALFLTLLTALSFSALAEPKLDLLKERLSEGTKIEKVKAAPIKGLYEIQIDGDVLYLTEDGEKIISGDIINIKDNYNYTEHAQDGLRKKALASVSDEDKIIFKAKNEKYKITVFTDISCPYCTQIHQYVPSYNDAGITVEYMAFPRAGIGSKNERIMQRIWCSADKAASLTAAKIERKLPQKPCTGSQVVEQFMLGQQIGIQATPSIVLSDGTLLAGMVKPDDLLEILEEKKEKSE